MVMSTDTSDDDERDAVRVMLSVPGCPPGWTLARIAEDAGLSERRTFVLLRRMMQAGSVIQRKHKPDGKPRIWHFYRSQREQRTTT